MRGNHPGFLRNAPVGVIEKSKKQHPLGIEMMVTNKGFIYIDSDV